MRYFVLSVWLCAVMLGVAANAGAGNFTDVDVQNDTDRQATILPIFTLPNETTRQNKTYTFNPCDHGYEIEVLKERPCGFRPALQKSVPIYRPVQYIYQYPIYQYPVYKYPTMAPLPVYKPVTYKLPTLGPVKYLPMPQYKPFVFPSMKPLPTKTFQLPQYKPIVFPSMKPLPTKTFQLPQYKPFVFPSMKPFPTKTFQLPQYKPLVLPTIAPLKTWPVAPLKSLPFVFPSMAPLPTKTFQMPQYKPLVLPTVAPLKTWTVAPLKSLPMIPYEPFVFPSVKPLPKKTFQLPQYKPLVLPTIAPLKTWPVAPLKSLPFVFPSMAPLPTKTFQLPQYKPLVLPTVAPLKTWTFSPLKSIPVVTWPSMINYGQKTSSNNYPSVTSYKHQSLPSSYQTGSTHIQNVGNTVTSNNFTFIIINNCHKTPTDVKCRLPTKQDSANKAPQPMYEVNFDDNEFDEIIKLLLDQNQPWDDIWKPTSGHKIATVDEQLPSDSSFKQSIVEKVLIDVTANHSWNNSTQGVAFIALDDVNTGLTTLNTSDSKPRIVPIDDAFNSELFSFVVDENLDSNKTDTTSYNSSNVADGAPEFNTIANISTSYTNIPRRDLIFYPIRV